jgi:hypothetical protein
MDKKKKVEQDGADHVYRGGSWGYTSTIAWVKRRFRSVAGLRRPVLGFRIARQQSALERLVDRPREVDDGQEEG